MTGVSIATKGKVCGALPLSCPTAAEIADAMWDEPMSEHILGGSFGKGVKMIKSGIDAIISFVS